MKYDKIHSFIFVCIANGKNRLKTIKQHANKYKIKNSEINNRIVTLKEKYFIVPQRKSRAITEYVFSTGILKHIFQKHLKDTDYTELIKQFAKKENISFDENYEHKNFNDLLVLIKIYFKNLDYKNLRPLDYYLHSFVIYYSIKLEQLATQNPKKEQRLTNLGKALLKVVDHEQLFIVCFYYCLLNYKNELPFKSER